MKQTAKIKIECEIEFNEDIWYSHNDEEELEWFISLLNDKENTMVVLHSNDVGDTIGQTNDFKWKIIKSE
jgi:predicted NUDIX family phosphoesterase